MHFLTSFLKFPRVQRLSAPTDISITETPSDVIPKFKKKTYNFRKDHKIPDQKRRIK